MITVEAHAENCRMANIAIITIIAYGKHSSNDNVPYMFFQSDMNKMQYLSVVSLLPLSL